MKQITFKDLSTCMMITLLDSDIETIRQEEKVFYIKSSIGKFTTNYYSIEKIR